MDQSTTALTLPDKQQFETDIRAINQFQKVVRANMIDGQDYGVIPGTSKPTLLKPGAEKIAKLLGLADQYEIIDRQEDWQRGFFRYLIKCSLNSVATGVTISEGLGECNSMESKYRWRESKRKCPQCDAEAIIKGKEEYGGGWLCFDKKGGCGAKYLDGDESIEGQKIGRVENDDIYSIVNTLVKMAKKRALVDAALSAGRLSQVFTQDIEDGTVIHDEPGEPKTVDKSQHWCQEHNCQFEKKGRGSAVWYAHSLPGGKWCNEKKKAEPVKEPTSQPEQAEKDASELFPEDATHAKEAAVQAVNTTDLLYAWIATNLNWKDSKPVRSWIVNKMKIEESRIDSDPEGVYEEIKALQGW